MSIQLTSGAVRKLEEYAENELCVLEEHPILQVIEIEKQENGPYPFGSYLLTVACPALLLK